ncbi:hypothetical protein KKB69_01055 [Patescibacteria group bacterium]|nr:hypothetical protein [Patescibacteria group bacterium]
MMDNNMYNLMLQLTQEHKSLWRIKNEYIKDAADWSECETYWKKLREDKEAHIVELIALVKKHLK